MLKLTDAFTNETYFVNPYIVESVRRVSYAKYGKITEYTRVSTITQGSFAAKEPVQDIVSEIEGVFGKSKVVPIYSV